MSCAKQQIAPFMEPPVPNFMRLLLWPPGFLPRRSVAPAQRSSSPDIAVLPPQAVETSTGAPDRAAAPEAGSPISLGERRAAALRKMFPMLLSMYARRSDLWQAIAIERYLSQATDIIDLEHRIREVERRRQFQWSE
jgi:hypothetical protein